VSKVTLIFGQEKSGLEMPDGAPFSEVVSAASLPLELPCAGRGTCGSCKVLVEAGGSPPDEIEREHLTPGELVVGTRLACRAKVFGDTQIVLSPIEVHSNKIFRAGSRHQREKHVPLGMAIDLGSTTVAAYLTMLDNGEVVAGGAALNQQRVYGADVISRLSAALAGGEHRERLQRLAISSIYQAIGSLKLSERVLARVRRVSVVGNVAMHHLLLGLPVDRLAVKPFQPYMKASSVDQAGLLSGIFPEDVQILIPGLIGGFVGSDALACLAYFGFEQPAGPTLAVDLGTNGEVLLTDGKRIVTASTAAGPAFEGVDISCGVRATDGAIVDAAFRDGVFNFQTIGDEPPVGLTGSGLLRSVWELVQAGVIEESGRFVSENPYFNLEREGGVNRIYLTEDHSIWLTQKDIRELQKAKGAIRAAIEILMDSLGLRAADLKKIILTGSFGGQLDLESVIALGMLPNVRPEIVQNIPNGAGFGAALFLDEEGFALGERLANQAEQIELDQTLNFDEIFVAALPFPSRTH
jgi:uncharacterized 2Fe-2S/4Fe-4S cluster protein (DUF4445 family)